MLEPENNPNPALMVDPPIWLRYLAPRAMAEFSSTARIEKKRAVAEKKRRSDGRPHVVEYFHQADDPYSHLTAQVLARFAQRYDVKIVPHLISATGGAHQPYEKKLAVWARRDAGLIAPHYGLEFPEAASETPDLDVQLTAERALANLNASKFLARLSQVSTDLWNGKPLEKDLASVAEALAAVKKGTARLQELGHYSGATLFYEGEWYWGVDRLFHLEQRLRDLGACKAPDMDYLVPRPSADVSGVDASRLQLHFYPSLNSPYTSIIYDASIEMARSCNIQLRHKPVLPMIMRGVPAPRTKMQYIIFDTKREADFFGVPWGKFISPIGEPTRRAYSLMPWAMSEGKDTELLSTMLRYAWSEARGLHWTRNIRKAVKEVGLDWREARKRLGTDDWKEVVEKNQVEMVEEMGLWGVPCYRLSGPHGEPDLEVWGQDRLWLVAAEVRRRAGAGAESIEE